jgi:hypothetical protein
MIEQLKQGECSADGIYSDSDGKTIIVNCQFQHEELHQKTVSVNNFDSTVTP